MATKKIEESIVETKKEATEKNAKTYKVKVPIDQLNPKDREVIVGVNEKYAKIIRGEETEVSEPVYEVLRNAGLV